MDNITHGLVGLGVVGVTMSIPEVNQDTALQQAVFWTAMISSQVPDFDILTKIKSKLCYKKNHRGASHSVPAMFIYAFIISAIVSVFVPASPVLLWLVSFSSAFLHVFFDLLTSYGTRALWPLKNKPYAWDVLMIVEIPIMFTGLLLSWLWLANFITTFEATVYFALFSLLYISFKLITKKIVVNNLLKSLSKHNDYSKSDPIFIFPTLNPWKWNFVASKDCEYFSGSISLFPHTLDVSITCAKIDESNPIISAGLQSQTGALFLKLSRCPTAFVKQVSTGYRVVLADLRFNCKRPTPLTASIELNKDLSVTGEDYCWNSVIKIKAE